MDATLSATRPKSTTSRFKSDRMASSYNVPGSSSTSLGPSLLPATSHQTLKRALRNGRLENNQLVGGDPGESASEPEDENAAEVLELLKKGEIYNAGPTPDSSATQPSLQTPQNYPTSTPNTQTIPGVEPSATPDPKISKFKLNISQIGRTNSDSNLSTPISDAFRSSPKLPATHPDDIEYLQPVPFISFNQVDAANSTMSSSSSQFSMIVDSPSFPPSGRAPSSKFEEEPNSSNIPGKRLDRPPTVMSSAVTESAGNKRSMNQMQQGKEKKVSRFLAERM